MSGIYGTIKPADISIDKDVEIYYYYRPSYNSDDTNFKNFKELSTSVLSNCKNKNNNNISGLFNLRLPLDEFNKKGIYTIYIKPKEIEAKIMDIGTLAVFPDVRGIIFNIDELADFKVGDSLVGYRVEYINNNGEKTNNFKIITSSNLCEPISYNLNNSSEKGTKYRYTDGGRNLFCTVTPSLAPTFKPNNLPLLGSSGEIVKLVNTKFNPLLIELELVEHDDETITYMLEGNQLIDKDNAIITTFNDKGEIYHQSEYGVYKDSYGNPLYEFRKTRDNIDFNQNLDNLE